jgi:hypothetical protein
VSIDVPTLAAGTLESVEVGDDGESHQREVLGSIGSG